MKKIIALIFIAIGAITTYLGAKVFIDDMSFYQNAKKETVNVVKVVVTTKDDKLGYQLYIEYPNEKGKEYLFNKTLTEKEQVPNELTILYDPKNPEKFVEVDFMTNYIMIGAGVVILLIAGQAMFRKTEKIIVHKELKGTGTLIDAEIIGITKVKRRYIIECKATIAGMIKGFKSEPVKFDAQKIYRNIGINRIDVYINPANLFEYYVDVEAYKENLKRIK